MSDFSILLQLNNNSVSFYPHFLAMSSVIVQIEFISTDFGLFTGIIVIKPGNLTVITRL